MKTGLISLCLMFVMGVALAQGSEQPQVGEPAAAATPEPAQVRTGAQEQAQKPAAGKSRPRKGGDIRDCLNRKTNKEIHRCAAKNRGK